MEKEKKTETFTSVSSGKEQINYKAPDYNVSYLDFFGFSQNPFPVVPDDKNFYVSKNIDQTMSELVYGIKERKGFMVLTGEVGLGKTTISRRIITILEEENIETSLVFHAAYSDVELLREINRDFGLIKKTKPVNNTLGDQMELLNTFLLAQNRKEKNCVIIIDDAQNLDKKSLELVRMISNLETDTQKLVQILLIGQPELAEKLNSKELRQLKSRIIINKKVGPLQLKDMQDYLQFKLNVCGSYGQVTITKQALKQLYGYSKGNFRLINVLMDRCLCVAFLHNSTEITREIVKQAGIDLSINRTVYDFKKAGLILSAVIILLLISGLIITIPSRKSESPVKKPSPGIVSETKKQLTEPVQKIPDSLSEFLKSYDLAEYSEPFYAALKKLDFTNLSETILAETGYQLIQLEQMTEPIRKKYGVLSCTAADGSKKQFVLFWKPTITISKFYYGYQGKDMLLLQQALKNAGIYYYAIDGIVGRNLMGTVVRFQRQFGLPVTGYPEKEFVFLLANQDRRRLPSPVVTEAAPEPETNLIETIDTDNAVQVNQERRRLPSPVVIEAAPEPETNLIETIDTDNAVQVNQELITQ